MCQAIAHAELSKVNSNGEPLYQHLIAESLRLAHWQFAKQTEATLEELAVELMVRPFPNHPEQDTNM